MSTATTIHPANPVLPALEISRPATSAPSLAELERLTAVPDRRVVFRGVDWTFYERLVDLVPEGSNIHVNYDGKDLEVMSTGCEHERRKVLLGKVVDVVAEEFSLPLASLSQMTWKRVELARGLQADACFYLSAEKIAAAIEASKGGRADPAALPGPDLAIEVDISRPAVDRAGIYAALRVAEVWRFDGLDVFIDQLTPDGTYTAAKMSLFLPVSVDDLRRWTGDVDAWYESAWSRRLRAEIRERAAK